ncbi:MAG: hypothetical protein V1816_26200 [Pseudomonadota bacterium]
MAIAVFLCLAAGPAVSPAQETPDPSRERLWSASVFYGIFSRKDLNQMARELPTAEQARTRWMFAAAVSRELWSWQEHFSLEIEGIGAKHYMKYHPRELEEIVLHFPLRVSGFPWDGYLRTTFAVGEGFSYCTKEPPNPDQRYDTDPRFLNYLMLEASFGLPLAPQADLVLRIHHRSGIFGLMGPSKVGNNYYNFGLRINF